MNVLVYILATAQLIALGPCFAGCKPYKSLTDTVRVSFQDSLIIEGLESIVPNLSYFGFQNDTFAWVGSYHGSALARINIENGKVIEYLSLETLTFDSVLTRQGNMAIPLEGGIPVLVTIQCNSAGTCYVGFFRQYWIYRDSVPYRAELAFISIIEDGVGLTGPMMIEHPDLNLWDLDYNTILSGIDAGSYLWQDRFFATSSPTYEDVKKPVILHYQREGQTFKFYDSTSFIPDIQWTRIAPFYILTRFAGNEDLLLVTDGKRVMDLLTDNEVFSSTHLDPVSEDGRNLGDVIIDMDLSGQNLHLLSGKVGIDKKRTYSIIVYDINNGTIKGRLQMQFEGRLYTWKLNSNNIFFFTKSENSFVLYKYKILLN